MAAFISIFYIISLNVASDNELENMKKTDAELHPYLKEHTPNRLANAAITVYFIMVGEFYTDNFN
jgi:hypothetical protein